MADTLDDTQRNTNSLTTSAVPDSASTSPISPSPAPLSNDSDTVPPEPPPPPEEPGVMSSPTPSDSLIIPPKGQKPREQAPVQKKVSLPPIGSIGKKRHFSVAILAVFLLLLIGLPLTIVFLSQKNSEADIRSRAANNAGYCTRKTLPGGSVYPGAETHSCSATTSDACLSDPYCTWDATTLPVCPISDCLIESTVPGAVHCYMPGYPNGTYCCPSDKPQFVAGQCVGLGTCPPDLTTCDNPGAECTSSKGNHYCCVKNSSGSAWAPKTWASCPVNGQVSCPWTLTNGKCCPTGGDACDYNAGQTKCVNDPFNSNCQKWGDGSCPGGGGVWIANHWYTDCKTEGCGGNPDLTCVPNAGGNGVNLCRNKNCPSDTDCVCAGTPTPTPPNNSCPSIEVYKNGSLVTDYSTLMPGDAIRILVGPSATQISIDGGTFENLTTKDSTTGKWKYDTTIPTNRTNFGIVVK